MRWGRRVGKTKQNRATPPKGSATNPSWKTPTLKREAGRNPQTPPTRNNAPNVVT